MNGIATIAAALFGSCFPTTIYIGHPGWKALGARAGYSTLNGLVITAICLTGTVSLINSLIPIEAGMAIVLWIGIIITAQAFQTTPREHAPAVAIGLFPAIAAWGLTIAQGAFRAAGEGVAHARTMEEALRSDPNLAVSGFVLHGLLVLGCGYIFTCMILAAIAAFPDRPQVLHGGRLVADCRRFRSPGPDARLPGEGKRRRLPVHFRTAARRCLADPHLRHRRRLFALRGGLRRFRLVRAQTAPEPHPGGVEPHPRGVNAPVE